jgi:peptidoglycan/LPS O-acetylase OafA/YrhL
MPGRLPHLPALDGLRGLAVVGVLLFHAEGALAGGYLGVDLFFVLSGYLITSLLLAESRDTGRIDLAAFWVRRARRLFPALLLLMPAIAAYLCWFGSPEEVAPVRWDALATLGYVANWHSIWAGQSYWDLFAAPSPLEHTWSLAIEEQFYLLWPILVLPVLRWRSPRFLLAVAGTMAVASMVAMAVLFDPANSSRVYLGTDTRAAGILIGACFAILLRPDTTMSPKSVRRLDVLGVPALLFLGLTWWTLEGRNPLLYRGGLWCTELAALALIACAVAGKRSLIARGLSLWPLPLLGRVSYGVYLWHWPVFVVLTADRLPVPPLALHGIRLAVTFAVAAASYRLVEQPIRKHGVPFGRPWLVVPAAAALAVTLLMGARPLSLGTARSAKADLLIGPRQPDEWRLLVVGDSVANTLGWSIRGLRSPTVSVVLGGEDGFSLLRDGPKWKTWSIQIREAQPDATLVVLSGAFLYGMTADDAWRTACHPAWTKTFETALVKRLQDLRSVDGLVWLATVPYPVGRYDKAKFRARVDCINRPLRRALDEVGGIRLFDLAELQCPKGQCTTSWEGETTRPDGVHYDIEGARDIAERTLAQLR